MSDDEFDSIPDEFANVQGIDWAALLSQTGPTSSAINTSELQDGGSPFPEPESRSSAYFSDDNNMDFAFLAELDHVEQQILLGGPPFSNAAPDVVGAQTLVTHGGAESVSSTSRLPDVGDIRTSRHIQRSGVIGANNGSGSSLANVPVGLSRTPIHTSSSRGGKAKAIEIQDILSVYEDELTCPICRDLLVAAHIGNPCGHTICGECGWQWHVEKRNKGCPYCRQALDKSVPMIPNIAIDNTVERHVKALAISGVTEWEPEGRRYTEWNLRKESWRKGAHKREWRKRQRTSIPIEIFDQPDDWLDQLQESDTELIPRPIRRVRRRQVIIQSGFELV